MFWAVRCQKNKNCFYNQAAFFCLPLIQVDQAVYEWTVSPPVPSVHSTRDVVVAVALVYLEMNGWIAKTRALFAFGSELLSTTRTGAWRGWCSSACWECWFSCSIECFTSNAMQQFFLSLKCYPLRDPPVNMLEIPHPLRGGLAASYPIMWVSLPPSLRWLLPLFG